MIPLPNAPKIPPFREFYIVLVLVTDVRRRQHGGNLADHFWKT
jgi:hypothetical protein